MNLNMKWPLMILLIFIAGVSNAKDWHVSTSGKAGAPGTKEKPFASLKEARDAIRMYKAEHSKNEAHTVFIHEGEYFLKSTFELNTQDSGSEKYPVVYKAVKGDEVAITTGTVIKNSYFRKAGKKELDYLKSEVHDKVIVADLGGQSLTNSFTKGKGKYGSLTWNQYDLQLAQWPNRGYCHLDKVIDMGPTLRWLEKGEKSPEFSFEKPIGGKFTMVEKTDFNTWAKELKRTEDIYQDGYLSIDWAKDANLLARVSNEGVIQLLDATRYGIGGVRYKGGFADPTHKPRFMANRRLLFRNILCELDMPGEWYFDRNEEKLYIYPIDDYKKARIAIPGGGLMMKLDQVSNVSVEGIIFENGGEKGLEVNGGENVTIAGCTFRNFNGTAALLSGSNNGFNSCDFYNLNGAFSISGGDLPTLTESNNYAINCDIHHLRLRGYGGIGLSGCGIVFKNNIYHDSNAGILYSGMRIEFVNNEFYNVGWEMGDWNVLYQGASKFCNGNLVENNFFHHFMEEPTRYPVLGARNDDGGTGTMYKSNIFYKTGRGAVAFGGPNSHIQDNIVLDCELIWWTGKAPTSPKHIQEAYDEIAEQFESGRYPRGGKEDAIYNVEQVVGKEGWNKPLFKNAFPNFHKYMNENPFAQSYGSMLNNYSSKVDPKDPYKVVHIHANWSLLEEGQPKVQPTMGNDMPKSFQFNAPQKVDTEKDFVDYKSLDFTFKPEFKLMKGFKPCDLSKVGLLKNEYRKNPPSAKEYRSELYQRYKSTPSSGGRYDQKTAYLRYPVQPWMGAN